MSTITLKSEHITPSMIAGTVCPACGKTKKAGSRTCWNCYKAAGGQDIAANTVEKVSGAIDVAEASLQRQPEKKVAAMEPFIAKLRVPKDAELNRDFPFYRMKFPVPGMGHVKVDVHGMDENSLGKEIVGRVEVKCIPARGNQIYVRVQVLPADIETDVRLAIQPKFGDETILTDHPNGHFAWEVQVKDYKRGVTDTRKLDVTVGAVRA